MASFKRTWEVIATTTAGETLTLAGDTGHSFYNQFMGGQPIINVIDGETGVLKSYNRDCICSIQATQGKGEDYVKPECDPLWCPEPTEPETPVEPQKVGIMEYLTKEEWLDRLYHPNMERETVEVKPKRKVKQAKTEQVEKPKEEKATEKPVKKSKKKAEEK